MNKVKISVIGDISFQGAWADRPSGRLFSNVESCFRHSDLVIGNLESPLVDNGQPTPNKCTLRGSTSWAKILKDLKITTLSLANNHIMDYGEAGLNSTISTLSRNNLTYLGAGRNISQACAPIFISKSGLRIALIARTSVIVSSPSYANENIPGVAFFDKLETLQTISASRKEADLVILLMHWGLENYRYPSHQQRQLARELIHGGVDLIIGHHPHVLQGIEQINQRMVAYSLGNFVFGEFEWGFVDSLKIRQVRKLKLDSTQKEGIILNFEISPGKQITYHPLFCRIDEQEGVIEDDREARKIDFDLLNRNLLKSLYQTWWKFYALKQEWNLRLQSNINIKKIIFNVWKIRPHHFKELFQSIRRSSRVASGKSTNPYE